jgi:outer membrane protein OmpA-like peptidoglycan-associated protein
MKSIFLIAVFALPAYSAEPPEPSREDPRILAFISGASTAATAHNTLSRPAAKNWKYTMQGIGANDDSAPSLTFDDGRFTYFRFSADREIPTVFAVSPQGQESRLNSHIDSVDTSLVAVEQIGRRFVLRSGNSTVRVSNEAFDSSSKLALPDGRTRVPINSQGAIDDYIAAAASENAIAQEEAQQRQADAFKRDLAELKVLMAELTLHQEELPAPAGNLLPARATMGRSGPAKATARKAKYFPTEKITIGDRSILFTITLGVGETQFAPSIAFQQGLLKAAKNATSIDILGATDATKANAESARTAKASAETARKYLLDNGIEAGRMTTTYLAARGFVAENATSAGKARNRRVEIKIE